MTRVYLYVLGASANPDLVECGVPWFLGDGEVFFGPCKKRIREELRKDLLRGSDQVTVSEPIYLAGFNALGGGNIRKVVWTGRIREAMSFGRAWKQLSAPRFKPMRQSMSSPLHVRPVGGLDSQPIAYQIVSDEHRKDAAWLADLATDAGVHRLIVKGDVARLPAGVTWWEGFGRDVCFLLDDCFVAGRETGGGLEIDDDLTEILRTAQPHRPMVDEVAVFGRTKAGGIYGRGHVTLTEEDDLAGRFLEWLERVRPKRGAAMDPKLPRGDQRSSERMRC